MIAVKPPSKRWGIVVGVDTYEHADEFLHNLQGCAVDARRMYDTMMDRECCGFLEDHVQLLLNPCYDELEEAFANVGSRMDSGDELWFYFAGHGYSDRNSNRSNGYLLLSGAKYDRRGFLRGTGSMSRDQLEDLIGQHVRAGGVTVISFLDCCCAASVGLNSGDRAVRADQGLDDIAVSFAALSSRDLELDGSVERPGEAAEAPVFMSLCATGTYGRAHEDKDGGLFTKRLVEGLLGGTREHPTTFGDVYVTAGALGLYVGAKMYSQGPKQNIPNPMYPLSVSPAKKRMRDRIDMLNGNVRSWLGKCTGCVADRQFAERVLLNAEDFEFGEIMRQVLRLVSDPSCTMKLEGDDAEGLLKAFHTLKRLMDEGGPSSVKKVSVAPRNQSVSDSRNSLSQQDRALLADVGERLREVDGKAFDLSDVPRRSQAEAIAALDAIVRKRMRLMCGREPYSPLFTKNEYDAWTVKARKGFSSGLEASVYELVKDDKALALRRW